jgi:hypothetical protein
MNYQYMLITLIIAGVGALGCTSIPVSDNCPILNVKQLLPSENISDYQLVSSSDHLSSDFYRVLLENNTQLISDIGTGVRADYNSSTIAGATVNILIIEFEDPTHAGTAASTLQSAVEKTISANATVLRENINRNNISYTSLRIVGLTNIHGVGFYQEFVFWHVHQYVIMAKQTTPDIGQDPHQEMLQFMDAMAKICSP